MGCSTYFIISLILFSNLFLSPVSAAIRELPRQRDSQRDSKFLNSDSDADLVRYRYFYSKCYRYGVFACPPPTAPTVP